MDRGGPEATQLPRPGVPPRRLSPLRGTDVLAKFAEKVNYIRAFSFLLTLTGNQKECLTREMLV